jgi:hypothetical protein
MDFFSTLGARVDALWQQQDYDEAHFPKVALHALEELPPRRHTSLLEVVSGATNASCLPPQTDMKAGFGDPPLTVFEGRNFRIEVLFWLRGVPGIHQHGFSGAFHVLEGSSIHTRWRFVAEERVGMRLVLGRVEFTDAEILQQGDNREILAGPSMYHATYHMDKPSLTVVVRTPNEADQQPQYLLTPPSIASTPFNRQDSVVRQAQLLNTMLQVRPAECLDHLRRLLSVKDGYWTYEVLQTLWRTIDDEHARQLLLATARQRHPRLTNALESSLNRFVREEKIMRVRIDTGDDPDLRYLLALLRNVPDASEIRRLLALRHPGRDVVELIELWVRRLAASGVLGFELHDSWIVTLRHLLRGASEEQIAEYFGGTAAKPGNPRCLGDVRELCEALKRSWLFQSLFASTQVSAP